MSQFIKVLQQNCEVYWKMKSMPEQERCARNGPLQRVPLLCVELKVHISKFAKADSTSQPAKSNNQSPSGVLPFVTNGLNIFVDKMQLLRIF